MNEWQKPVLIALSSEDRDTLESFCTEDNPGVKSGAVKEREMVADANLNPWDVAQLVYQVVGVVGTAGGAIQFAAWVVNQILGLRKKSSSLTIQIGEIKVEVSGDSEPEALREQLLKLLGA